MTDLVSPPHRWPGGGVHRREQAGALKPVLRGRSLDIRDRHAHVPIIGERRPGNRLEFLVREEDPQAIFAASI